MANQKVQSSAWPDGGYKTYGPEGMEPVKPKYMSRVEYQAVKKQVQNIVRPGGVCYENLKQELSGIKGISV